MASRLTAIHALLDGVAHEIKNPLNAIRLQLEVVRAHCRGAAEGDGALTALAEEVHRLDRVLQALLQFTHPIELSLVPVDLNYVAQEMAGFVRAAHPGGLVTCLCEPFASPLLVRGDATMVKQALSQIVVNALEAMPEGGKLTLQVKREAGAHIISVSDTGPGIPDDLQPQVFRLYCTTKPQRTGAGLALAYRAIQLHAGALDFVSRPGQGTTFNLRFPAA